MILAAILFGISGTAAKFLFSEGMTAFQLIQLRTTLASVGLLVWMGCRRPGLLKVSSRHCHTFSAWACWGSDRPSFSTFWPSAKSMWLPPFYSIIQDRYLWLCMSFWYRKNGWHLAVLLAISGTLLGCFLVVGTYNLQLFSLNRIGITAGILAAISFAVYSVLSDYGMRKYTPWTVLTMACCSPR